MCKYLPGPHAHALLGHSPAGASGEGPQPACGWHGVRHRAWMLGETHAYVLIVELGLGHVYATFGGHSCFEGIRFVAGLLDR
ncbi:hypothetical protein BC826DRAFT_96950 [Russula brevipes]|nr:hypothetical protein BC826DRAFT_96950 [Russula brevipes]